MIFGEKKLDDRRPCLVGGDHALFHRWTEQDEVIKEQEKKTYIGLRRVYALIEYIDGTVELVRPELVRFTDN